MCIYSINHSIKEDQSCVLWKVSNRDRYSKCLWWPTKAACKWKVNNISVPVLHQWKSKKKSMAKHMSMLNHICRELGPTAAPALAGQRDEKKARHGQTRCVFPISKTPNGALCACLLCLIHCGSLAFPSFIIFDFRFYCYSYWNFGSGLCWAPARQFGALLWPWSPPTVCSIVWCFFATVSAIRRCGCHLILLPCKDVQSQKWWASLCN